MGNQNHDIEDYFSNNKTDFWPLLKQTEKWKEIYNQKECKISLLLTLVIIFSLCLVYRRSEFDQYIILLNSLVQIIIESTVGMLGFIISGLAIFTGTITTKLVNHINNDNKIDQLIGILFSFCFIGFIMGLSVVFYIIIYIFLSSNYQFNISKLLLFGFICSYLYLYCIFYSISLLQTCLKLFFVSYKYSEENNRKRNLR